MRLIKLGTLSILSILLSGCNRVDLGYFIVSYKLKSYIEDSYHFKNDKIEKQVLSAWSQDLKNNQSLIYQDLSTFIAKVQELSQDNKFDRNEIDVLFMNFSIHQKKWIHFFEKSIALTLSVAEKVEMENHERYLLRKIEEDGESDEKSIKKYKDKTKQALEFFFDSVNKTQEELVDNFIQANRSFLINQKKIKKQFAQKLTTLFPDKEAATSYYIAYYSADESIRDIKYKEDRQIFEENLKALLVNLWSSSADEQKAEFHQRLQSIVDQLSD